METLNKNILLAGEVIAERWKIVEKIGEGTFSQIYLAFSLHDNKRVAVKVEAPSSLKPVLEWEASILKSLQDCDHVCRYYYHGKHADSTVLVMELLGESMSMLRVTPDAIHGVPLARCVSVGLEMLDCIEAFHRHGFVHRDIKASNFAMSDSANPAKRKYFIIDFGLSRQHVGDDKRVIPARAQAEFRGTSMYASLSSHRRQELGPKDDLWSWFYLVMDFMRGELPWATDAQKKNRETVLTLKEYYTEKCPSLLVEGLIGASHLVAMMKYLQGLAYDDTPDYDFLRRKLKRVESSSKEEDTMELWTAIESDRERALQWAMRAKDALTKHAPTSILDTLLTVAKRFRTFFGVEDLSRDERLDVQDVVYQIELKLDAAAHALAPPPIQSFVKRRLSEQKGRSDALRRRRERDFQIRQSLEQKARRAAASAAVTSQAVGSPANGMHGANGTRVVEHKSDDSAMEMSDGDETATPPPQSLKAAVDSTSSSAGARQPPAPLGPPPPPQPQPQSQSQQRWHVPAVHAPFNSSPRVPPPPLPPGAPSGVYTNQPQPPLPPGPMYPPLPGAAFVPPLPPPLPPGYAASPSGNERRTPEPESRNGDRSSQHRSSDSALSDRRERESSHRERSRRSRRSHSRDRRHRSSRYRSTSSSRSRSYSRSRSRSRSRSSSRGRSQSPAHSSKRSRSHRRSWSSSPSRSRSPRRRGSRSRHSRSSERHHHHHHHHHYYIAPSSARGDDKRRSRSRSRSRERPQYADEPQGSRSARDDRARREPSRWQSR